ncbi:MAG: DUF4339 domain-containing protein [Akkermansia sp.]|nr:DUF4339 domain-containing protein [Akkermansia sp.]
MTTTRYYITKPGGTPTGPISLDSLRVMAQQGALTPDMLCRAEDADEWKPAGEIVIIHNAPVHAPQACAKPDTRLTKSIVLLVLSLVLFPLSFFVAVPAVIFAALAENEYNHMRMNTCLSYAESARLWVNISVVVTAVQLISYIAVLLFVLVIGING